jgi:cation-transporting ATPase 13A2
MSDIYTKYGQGLTTEGDYQLALLKFGPCNIEVPVKSIPELLVYEVLNPFYLFQIFSMVLWYYDDYRLYAACILLISVTSATTSLRDTLNNLKNIRKMAYYNCKVKVMRSGDERQLQEIDSEKLVPGDIIEIPENCNMPCDLALLSGTCIVNESMLTGESIPVIKNPLPRTKEVYNAEQD